MNGVIPAVLLSSAALIAVPAGPQRRLTRPTQSMPGHRRRVTPLGANGIGSMVVIAAFVAAAVLPLTTMLAAAVVGATAGLRYRRRVRLRCAANEGRALETALDALVSELRVGSHPVRAFRVAADETDGTVAASLRAVSARARLGADVTAGLRAAARVSALPAHWERLAVCWRLAADHGLAIATLMRAAQRDIVERQRFSARVESGMAGARATAAILAGLPALGVLLGQLIGARPLNFLFSDHAGGWLLVVGSMLACAGLLWSDRITDRIAA
jgi:tight adherence protein B